MDDGPRFSIPRIKYYKVIACPECGNSKKRFKTLRELNIHSGKVHPEKNIKYFRDKKDRITSRPRTSDDIKSIIHNDPSFKKWFGGT